MKFIKLRSGSVEKPIPFTINAEKIVSYHSQQGASSAITIVAMDYGVKHNCIDTVEEIDKLLGL